MNWEKNVEGECSYVVCMYVDDTKEMCKDCKGCFFDILVGSFAIPFWRRTCLCLMQEDTSVVGNVCRS